MRRTAGWTAQALLAYSTLLTAIPKPTAGDEVEIIMLVWNSGSPGTLTLYAAASLDDGNVRLLAYTGDKETEYPGTATGDGGATFEFPAPPAGQLNSYQLLVVDGAGTTVHKGLVTFTLMGEIITCGDSQFCRITSGVVEGATCSSLNACYNDTQLDNDISIDGLDSANPNLIVSVPTSVFSDASATPADGFVADTLTYEDQSASFHITHELESPIMLTELLSRAEGGEDLMVSACDGDLCTLDITPSSTNYELCGVFLDSDAVDTSLVTNVGITTFQDLNLIVDTSDVPINFRFVRPPPGDGIFEVYHGSADSSSAFEKGPAKLDCSRVPVNSFCYGAVIEASTYVAVTYSDKVNSVVAPVPETQKFRAGH